MSKIIRTIAVSDKQQAIIVLNALAERYYMTPTDPDNNLDISNANLNAYYNADEKLVTMETLNPDHSDDFIQGLLISFPTFF